MFWAAITFLKRVFKEQTKSLPASKHKHYCLHVLLSKKIMLPPVTSKGCWPSDAEWPPLPEQFMKHAEDRACVSQVSARGAHSTATSKETRAAPSFTAWHQQSVRKQLSKTPTRQQVWTAQTPHHCRPLSQVQGLGTGTKDLATEQHRLRIYKFSLQKWGTYPHESLHRSNAAVSRKYTNDWVFIIQTLLVVPKALRKKE